MRALSRVACKEIRRVRHPPIELEGLPPLVVIRSARSVPTSRRRTPTVDGRTGELVVLKDVAFRRRLDALSCTAQPPTQFQDLSANTRTVVLLGRPEYSSLEFRSLDGPASIPHEVDQKL